MYSQPTNRVSSPPRFLLARMLPRSSALLWSAPSWKHVHDLAPSLRRIPGLLGP